MPGNDIDFVAFDCPGKFDAGFLLNNAVAKGGGHLMDLRFAHL